jgi:malate dehydrogenase (oxaloacetate-decarboxylating)
LTAAAAHSLAGLESGAPPAETGAMPDYAEESLQKHRALQGKIEVRSRMRLESMEDLSVAYTPGVAAPCRAIAADPAAAWDLTWKGRTVAVVSDGSAILGLGDLGPLAALPVMEGKAALFREFGGIDAVPIVLDEREPEAIVRAVRAIAPTFGGINLEDIAAPRCFAIEDALQDLGIPVLHDDQHGTAIVLLAALVNATRVLGTTLGQLSVVINGAGAAGRAIARLLCCSDADDRCIPVGKVRVCDSKGVLWPGRPHNDPIKEELARATNPDGERGGAAIVGTGRSDLPNQVNNVLAFPGLFRGALAARAKCFTTSMKFAAAEAIADATGEPAPRRILPPPFDRSVAVAVAERVAQAARDAGVCHGGSSGDGS